MRIQLESKKTAAYTALENLQVHIPTLEIARLIIQYANTSVFVSESSGSSLEKSAHLIGNPAVNSVCLYDDAELNELKSQGRLDPYPGLQIKQDPIVDAINLFFTQNSVLIKGELALPIPSDENGRILVRPRGYDLSSCLVLNHPYAQGLLYAAFKVGINKKMFLTTSNPYLDEVVYLLQKELHNRSNTGHILLKSIDFFDIQKTVVDRHSQRLLADASSQAFSKDCSEVFKILLCCIACPPIGIYRGARFCCCPSKEEKSKEDKSGDIRLFKLKVDSTAVLKPLSQQMDEDQSPDQSKSVIERK